MFLAEASLSRVIAWLSVERRSQTLFQSNLDQFARGVLSRQILDESSRESVLAEDTCKIILFPGSAPRLQPVANDQRNPRNRDV